MQSTINISLEFNKLISKSCSTQESNNVSQVETSIQLNYCPLCGRHLIEEEEG